MAGLKGLTLFNWTILLMALKIAILAVFFFTYWVPIVTLNQNKQSRFLYLGDAQTIKRFMPFLSMTLILDGFYLLIS